MFRTTTRFAGGDAEFTADSYTPRRGSQLSRARLRRIPASLQIDSIERPAVGERIGVKFDGLEAPECTVRWVADHIGGVKFGQPLREAVFSRLVQNSNGRR
jgi:hypothetical protein